MGLALAVVFLPLYLIMSIVAIRLARASKADRAEGRGYELLGMALATVMTWGWSTWRARLAMKTTVRCYGRSALF